MSTISRASLPEGFYDYTDAKLLSQPEPKYIFARMFLNAHNIGLAQVSGFGLPFRDNSGNGQGYMDAERDRLSLDSAEGRLSAEMFAVRHQFSGGAGHTVRFNRPKYAETTYTQGSRQVATGSTISTTPINVGSEQVSLTVGNYAGPYDQSNGRVAPFGVEKFDASMGVHDLYAMAGVHLVRDFHKWLDAVYVAILDDGTTTVRPQGISADNDMTTADHPLTYEQISRANKTADEANLPTLGDGKRLMVVSPTGKKQLRDDPQFAAYAKENMSTNPLFPGWFGSTDENHFVCSNTLSKTDNSSSIEIHSAKLIAPGALLGGIARAPYVADSTDDNFGLTKKVIWLAELAMGLADQRFSINVNHTEDA